MSQARNDIRLRWDTFEHHKFKKLRRQLGERGQLALVKLWCAIAANRPRGFLGGYSNQDLEIMAGWEPAEGDPDFVTVLRELNFLEESPEGLVAHEWALHQPFVARRPERQEQARRASEARWNRHKSRPVDADRTAESPEGHSPYSNSYPHSDTQVGREGTSKRESGGVAQRWEFLDD